ncbi:polyprenyl synthetase family protein [Streptomyces sp. NPDC041003]|uniref:polyprenyl synthetase family protein n=1 Tax=Streptomyces sp. NPDC041003 TaxID=3155730 RepID=UPI0033E3A1C3
MTTVNNMTRPGESGLSGLTSFLAGGDLLQRELTAIWGGRRDPLGAIAEHALVPAGKLLRPLLVLESARCVGGAPEELTELALAIEYLHVATLIHDDIIDEDDIRRGRPSVQAAFGVPAAIVAGDGLILETFAALTGARPAGVSDADIVAVTSIMASAGVGVCRGQLLESEFVGDLNCGVEQYLTMAQLKTGALFEAACRIGAVLGTGRQDWIDALGTFGMRLGTAFQVRDDLLAFDGSSALIGKPRESDLQNRRPTLPILLSYQRASSGERWELERAFREDCASEESFAVVGKIVESTGGREAAQQFAADLIADAKDCLTRLPAGESTDTLAQIADYSSGRAF